MATAGKRRIVPAPESAVEDWWQHFDHYARSYLGVSGAEFIQKYDAGEIEVDDPEFHTRYIRSEMLLPFVRDVAPRT